MMKHEFETLIGQTVSPNDYYLIETVYRDHESITDFVGKKQIADIYKKGGINAIWKMFKEVSDEKPVMETREDIFSYYDVSYDWTCHNERPKTMQQVYDYICNEMKEKYPELWRMLDYFDIWKYDGITHFPLDYKWIAVFYVRGGSEGHYFHVEAIKDGKITHLFLGKTLSENREDAILINSALSRILEV